MLVLVLCGVDVYVRVSKCLCVCGLRGPRLRVIVCRFLGVRYSFFELVGQPEMVGARVKTNKFRKFIKCLFGDAVC